MSFFSCEYVSPPSTVCQGCPRSCMCNIPNVPCANGELTSAVSQVNLHGSTRDSPTTSYAFSSLFVPFLPAGRRACQSSGNSSRSLRFLCFSVPVLVLISKCSSSISSAPLGTPGGLARERGFFQVCSLSSSTPRPTLLLSTALADFL